MNDLSNMLDRLTPAQRCLQVAERAKTRRKRMGLTQRQLASKSGVSLGSLRRFEQTGEISFHSLVRISVALDCDDDFDALFSQRYYRSIQEVIDAHGN